MMKVQCPKCQTTYIVDDKKLPNKGINVRCKKCQNQFFIKKELNSTTDLTGTYNEKIVTKAGYRVCPKCKLPQEGINECEYCGFIFKEKKKRQGLIGEPKIVERKKKKSAVRMIFMFLLALILGLYSGFLIYIESAMIFYSCSDDLQPILFVLITFIGGWILSTFIILRGTDKISEVFSKGFLVGTIEWFAMIPIGIYFAGRISASGLEEASSGAEAAGAGLAFEFMLFFGNGPAIFMTILCLIGFIISFIVRRKKWVNDVDYKECPYCEETIKVEAVKCRSCGAELQQV